MTGSSIIPRSTGDFSDMLSEARIFIFYDRLH